MLLRNYKWKAGSYSGFGTGSPMLFVFPKVTRFPRKDNSPPLGHQFRHYHQELNDPLKSMGGGGG